MLLTPSTQSEHVCVGLRLRRRSLTMLWHEAVARFCRRTGRRYVVVVQVEGTQVEIGRRYSGRLEGTQVEVGTQVG